MEVPPTLSADRSTWYAEDLDQMGLQMANWAGERGGSPMANSEAESCGGAFGTASASGVNAGSGAVGAAPTGASSAGSRTTWPKRRDEPTKPNKIDWWAYKARDLRRQSYGMETRMEKGPLIDSLHYLGLQARAPLAPFLDLRSCGRGK